MNIAQIAKLAGVSSAAVSRYFNNGYISEEKKEAIRRVVEETGYHPSTFAQTLRTNRTMLVGVIAPRVASFSVGRMIDGILDSLYKSGYQMLLAVSQNDPEKEVDYLRTFNARQVDGVILIATVFTPAHAQALKEMKVPVVIVGQKLAGYPSVYHDDYHAMYDMTSLMLRKGRQNFAYMGVLPEDIAAGTERLKGYQDAVTDAGRKDLADRVLIGDFEMKTGARLARTFLQTYPDLDGLICATDMMAAGAALALSQDGIEVPGQVLISGQGDNEMTLAVGHGVLSIHYAYEQSGQMAAMMLLRRLKGEDDPVDEICLGYRLVDPDEETE